MATISIHNVVRIDPEPIRQLDSCCTRTIAVWTKPLGSTIEQAEEVVLFAKDRDALWLGHAVEDQKGVEVVQARLEGVPDRIKELERDLKHAQAWVQTYGCALAKVANAGLGRGALSEAIKVAENALGDDLDFYASLNGEAAA